MLNFFDFSKLCSLRGNFFLLFYASVKISLSFLQIVYQDYDCHANVANSDVKIIAEEVEIELDASLRSLVAHWVLLLILYPLQSIKASYSCLKLRKEAQSGHCEL